MKSEHLLQAELEKQCCSIAVVRRLQIGEKSAEKGFVRIGGQSVVKAHSRGTLTEQGLAKLLQADAGGRNGSKTVDVER